jgi:membrane associated rhomboid family serine protease
MRHNAGQWRIFSALFLHAGLIHLFINLYIQVCFGMKRGCDHRLKQVRLGIYLERAWKWSKVSAIYFLSGIGGGLLSCVIR